MRYSVLSCSWQCYVRINKEEPSYSGWSFSYNGFVFCTDVVLDSDQTPCFNDSRHLFHLCSKCAHDPMVGLIWCIIKVRIRWLGRTAAHYWSTWKKSKNLSETHKYWWLFSLLCFTCRSIFCVLISHLSFNISCLEGCVPASDLVFSIFILQQMP